VKKLGAQREKRLLIAKRCIQSCIQLLRQTFQILKKFTPGVKELDLDCTKTKPETFWDELKPLMLVIPHIKGTFIGC